MKEDRECIKQNIKTIMRVFETAQLVVSMYIDEEIAHIFVWYGGHLIEEYNNKLEMEESRGLGRNSQIIDVDDAEGFIDLWMSEIDAKYQS